MGVMEVLSTKMQEEIKLQEQYIEKVKNLNENIIS